MNPLIVRVLRTVAGRVGVLRSFLRAPAPYVVYTLAFENPTDNVARRRSPVETAILGIS